jgi:hypothetical protein
MNRRNKALIKEQENKDMIEAGFEEKFSSEEDSEDAV